MRKITDFKVMDETEHQNACIIALCEGGSLWALVVKQGSWQKLPDLPLDMRNKSGDN